ncbi:MAG: hypothetical protein AB1428_04965 [Bacteroidota bacterium]
MKVRKKGSTMQFMIFAITVLGWWFDACNTIEPEPPVPRVDTTSHEFTWTVQTLGDGNSSALFDVAIASDSLAYAAGEIYLRDSSGGFDPLAYNIANWNGEQWKVKRVTVSYRGSNITPSLNAVFLLSPTEIWLSAGVPIFGDGQNWTQYHLFDMGVLTQNDGSILKLWASSPSSVYFVGNRGTIVQNNGQTWQKLSSGSTGTIQDIWGIADPKTGSRYVLCAVSEAYSLGGQRLLEIKSDNSVDTIPWVAGRRPHSVWFTSPSQVFTSGDGVFSRGPDYQWREIAGMSVLPVFTERIRGVSDNDFFVVGDFGAIAHFNGANFKVYPAVAGSPIFTSLDYKNGLMIAVGYTSSQAVIVTARR